MKISYITNVLWTASGVTPDPKPFADRVQACCRALEGLDDRTARLRRGKSAVAFADLPPAKAAAFVLKDGFSITVCTPTLSKGYLSLRMNRGSPPHTPGRVQMSADDNFWRDGAAIRRVTAALVDIWNAEQVAIFTSTLPGRDWHDKGPWYFWLDWRRTSDAPNLMPNVRMFGEPSIEREWHGGVERLWPEHEPWRHLGGSGPA